MDDVTSDSTGQSDFSQKEDADGVGSLQRRPKVWKLYMELYNKIVRKGLRTSRCPIMS
ncbi:hypothetical protein DPMN_138090 [Dreissena polymorpha]|uniref:Uncharacterized protein n=1 Tax=Dreissena polymorpha TaxID=45954 RepID=A0A9D4G5Z4_DREPO|nr:hypothetical protein DPMN_138090 [Dreissena polymorpha]